MLEKKGSAMSLANLKMSGRDRNYCHCICRRNLICRWPGLVLVKRHDVRRPLGKNSQHCRRAHTVVAKYDEEVKPGRMTVEAAQEGEKYASRRCVTIKASISGSETRRRI